MTGIRSYGDQADQKNSLQDNNFGLSLKALQSAGGLLWRFCQNGYLKLKTISLPDNFENSAAQRLALVPSHQPLTKKHEHEQI